MNPILFSWWAQLPVAERRFMGAAWFLLVLKCALLWWAIEHWRLPLHPLWLVIPSLAFGVLATWTWMAYRRE